MVRPNPGPLHNIRVANLSQVWAGPHGMQQFADMGAEVIRVESIQVARGTPLVVPKPARDYPDRDPGADPWNRSLYFNDGHVGMFGVTMDLTRPQGKDLLRKLIMKCDFLIENFAYGVMDRLGLGYDVVSSWKPDIIYVSAPGYGAGGPESHYVAYGTNQLHMTGIANITGYAGEGPMQTAVNYGDPTAGIHMAACVLAAMLYRLKTGKGQFIDVSQREPGIAMVGEYFLDYVMNGRTGTQIGNRHSSMAPYGCYPSRGDDMWLTIAVRTDDEWKAFCKVLGDPEWTRDPRFQDALGRWKNQDDLDKHISEWTKELDHYEAMYRLQAAGIAAGAVLKNSEVFEDPQNKSREFYQAVTHPTAGTHRWPRVGWTMSKTPGYKRRPSPCLGEHNEQIYKGLLGISDAEFEELESTKIIGKIPLPESDPGFHMKKKQETNNN